jgi:hypothetical protein
MDAQHRATLIFKCSFSYDEQGTIGDIDGASVIDNERSHGGPCDLAPFLRGTQLVCIGGSAPAAPRVGLALRRKRLQLVERELDVDQVSALGPVAPAHPAGLAAFGQRIIGVPAGTDGAVFSVAPPEQRTGPMAGGERLVLTGLDPTVSELTVPIPPFRLGVAVQLGPAAVPFDVRLDTLIIEPAERRVLLVWRGSFPLSVDALDDVSVQAKMHIDEHVDVASHTVPFAGAKVAPPIATTLHADKPTGTVQMNGYLPRHAGTPFREKHAKVTVELSRDVLRKEADAVPFQGIGAASSGAGATGGSAKAPIPGAPWSAESSSAVVRPMPGASRTIIGGEVEDEPPPAEPPPAEDVPPDSPPRKTREEIERGRPKEAWVKGPEIDLEAAKAKPTRAKRKNLNALLYGDDD